MCEYAENARLRLKINQLRGGIEQSLSLLRRATGDIGGLFSTDHELYDHIMSVRPDLARLLKETQTDGTELAA